HLRAHADAAAPCCFSIVAPTGFPVTPKRLTDTGGVRRCSGLSPSATTYACPLLEPMRFRQSEGADRAPRQGTVWRLRDDARAVGDARDLARRALLLAGLRRDLVEDAVLMVSELATNAVLYGDPPYELVVRVDSAEVRSEEHTSELQSRENLVCR